MKRNDTVLRLAMERKSSQFMRTMHPSLHRRAGKQPARLPFAIRFRIDAFLALALAVGTAASAFAAEADLADSARLLYNDGTQKLRDGKWREAEATLQTAVARSEGAVQTAALYNLAHVRFQQGVDVLKDAPDRAAARKRGDSASAAADGALRIADEALAGYDLDAIVAAYMHGRGVRKEIKKAREAVKEALETHGAVIARWQRASGDFKSALELRGRYDSAQHNAELVDRELAKLIDQQEAMQMCMQCMSNKGQELKEKMAKMKDLLPDSRKQECQGDEDDDEETDKPKEPQEGQKEAKPRDGREMWVTPEEARRLLEAMQLDGNRKLPMGFEESRQPRDRGGRVW